jgi:hypothetical protein
MEELAKLPDIKPMDLKYAQRCRLYLGATTLADITNSNCRTLCGWALSGHDQPWHTTFHFPRQAKPSPKVWAIWRKLLRLRYCQQHTNRIDQPLGPWIRGHITQVWDSAIDPATSLLYIWIDRRVRIYEQQGWSQKQFRYLRPHSTNSFPIGCVPISGHFQAGNFIVNQSTHRLLDFSYCPKALTSP